MTAIVTVSSSILLYLLLAGSAGTHEIIAAVLVTILVFVWTRAVRRCTERRFDYSRELNALSRRIPQVLLKGTLRGTWALLLGRRGRAMEFNFEHGALHSSTDRARRAVALLVASLAPDSFVTRLDQGRQALFHDITANNLKRDSRWLI